MLWWLLDGDFSLLVCGRTALVPSWWFLFIAFRQNCFGAFLMTFSLFCFVAELLWCLLDDVSSLLLCCRTALVPSWWRFLSIALLQNCFGAFLMTFPLYCFVAELLWCLLDDVSSIALWQNCFGAFLMTFPLYWFVAELLWCLLDDFSLLLLGRTALVPSWWRFLSCFVAELLWCLLDDDFSLLLCGRTALVPSWWRFLSCFVAELLWCLLDDVFSLALLQNCFGAFLMTFPLYCFVVELLWCLLDDDFSLLLLGRTALVPSWWFLFIAFRQHCFGAFLMTFPLLLCCRTALVPSWWRFLSIALW